MLAVSANRFSDTIVNIRTGNRDAGIAALRVACAIICKSKLVEHDPADLKLGGSDKDCFSWLPAIIEAKARSLGVSKARFVRDAINHIAKEQKRAQQSRVDELTQADIAVSVGLSAASEDLQDFARAHRTAV